MVENNQVFEEKFNLLTIQQKLLSEMKSETIITFEKKSCEVSPIISAFLNFKIWHIKICITLCKADCSEIYHYY